MMEELFATPFGMDADETRTVLNGRNRNQTAYSVIEIKKSTNVNPKHRERDDEKLKNFTNPNAPGEHSPVFNYTVGLFLDIETVQNPEDTADLVARGVWYKDGERANFDSPKHSGSGR